MLRMIAFLISVIISSTSLLAQEYEPNPNIPISSSIVQDNLSQISIKSKPLQPFVTQFGVYPALLWDFDLSKNTFKISFYAWWRTHDPNYQPEKSIEIINATDYYSKFGRKGKNDNEYFTYAHYYATVQKNWDTRFFPFDRQILEVKLEDFQDAHYVIFEPDILQSHLHKELVLPGWQVEGLKLEKSMTSYATNFGDTSVKNGKYARLTFHIDIKREGWRSYFNYFIGFFVAFFLCAMIFFVDPGNINARANLSLGSIFTAVGNKYVLDQKLPFTSLFTLYDAIQAATFCVIVLSILSFILIHDLLKDMGLKKARTINGLLAVIIVTLYLVYVGVWTFAAVVS
jgi:hypothetical protein